MGLKAWRQIHTTMVPANKVKHQRQESALRGVKTLAQPMSAQAVIDLANAIKTDAKLKALCASSHCADVDDQCRIAKEKGFDVHPNDFDQFNNGDLIESNDEDTFLKPSWWERISQH